MFLFTIVSTSRRGTARDVRAYYCP